MRRIPTHANWWNGFAAGLLVWLVLALGTFFGFFPLDLIQTLFLLAPLVIVRLGLSLLAVCSREERRLLLVAIVILQPIAILPTVACFFIPASSTAAIFSGLWLIFACMVFGEGIVHSYRRGFRGLADACFLAAQAYLPVGAGWLLLSRWGATPLGFAEPIVLLTSVHFHFAGFASAILAGATVRRAASVLRQIPSTLRIAAAGIIVAPALVAAGFVFSTTLQMCAVIAFAVCLCLLSWHVFSLLPGIRSRIVRTLLAVSAGCVPVGMIFAIAYTSGDVQGQLYVSIPNMAAIHGTLNGIGYCLCGLLAWTLQVREETNA